MQKVKLPKQLDPIKSANKRSEYRGVMLTQDMSRLVEAVAETNEHINIEIQFDKDAQGLVFFKGRLDVDVSLSCQRCNESFAHPLHLEFCFSPVLSQEEIDELPEIYEPIEVDDQGEINLLQVFEDELILSLPIVAFHAEESCNVKRDEMSYGKIDTVDKRPNPFAVLKELKQDQE